MNRTLKIRYIAAALIALAMIAFSVVNSALSTRANLVDFRMVAHTRVVLESLGSAISSMQELEAAQRNYLLLGEPALLGPYERARDQVDFHIGELSRLTRDNPAQQIRIGGLKEAARIKKDEMARSLERRSQPGGEAAARELAAKEVGSEMMTRFGTLIAEMREEENRLLELRLAKLVASLKNSNLVVAVTGGIAMVAGIAGMAMLLLFFRTREREETLRGEKDKAIQSDKAKSEFLAMMSHEIRTPMNAILGFGELLEDQVETHQQKHYAKAILSSGNSLLLLINDILDLSKIEAEKLELHPELVEISAFGENLETLFSYRAAEKGIDYSVQIDPAMPLVLSFDALRFRQIMVNLVGNAIKFTRDGYVKVRLSAEEERGIDRVLVRVEVEDTGIGIAEDELEQIFRPFYQVDSRNSRHYQGTGLGLTISERLVRAMGGSIGLDSTIGKGSTFRITVPARRSTRERQATTGERPAVDFNRLAPAKILVADDVPLNRELIRGYLESSHHQLLEAENGEQAVILCRKHRPDIALLDIRMPVMDGREVRVRLKGSEETRGIHLIALSASSLRDSQEELKKIFDGYADKPLNRERLFVELAKFLPAHHPSAVAAPPAAPPVPEAPAPSPAVIKDPAGLGAELRRLHAVTWPNLVGVAPAQATIGFAGRLAELSRDHECAELGSYATALGQAAETFDLAAAAGLLDRFPMIVSQFTHSDA